MNTKAFIEKEFPLSVRAQFIAILQTGLLVAKSIFEEHPQIYASTISTNIRGRVFAFAVMLQFTPDVGIFQKFQYETNVRKVNSFGYTIPEIITADSIMHIVKSPSRNKLPAVSKYKKEYSINNSGFNTGQIKFDIDSIKNEIGGTIAAKKYILLNYGSKDNIKLDFAQLIMPDSNYANILEGEIDLFEELHLYKESITDSSRFVEKQLVALKENVKRQLKIDLKDFES